MDKEREAAMLVAANILNGPFDKIDSANLEANRRTEFIVIE